MHSEGLGSPEVLPSHALSGEWLSCADVLPEVPVARADAVAGGHAAARAGVPVPQRRPGALRHGQKAHLRCVAVML